MALETLKGIGAIGGFKLVIMDELREKFPEKFNESGSMDYKWFEKDIRPNNFIYVRNDVNSLAFTLQNGPVKENGVNGCQIDTVIETAVLILQGLNKKMPSRENSLAITKFQEGLMWLGERTRKRTELGIEGTSRADKEMTDPQQHRAEPIEGYTYQCYHCDIPTKTGYIKAGKTYCIECFSRKF